MIDQETTIEMMRKLVAIDEELASHEDTVASLKAARTALEAELFDRMVDEGVQHVSVDGRTVYRSTTIRGSIKADSKVQAVEALRELNLGDLIKSEPTVHPATMAAKIREWMEHDGRVPEIIEPYLSIFEAHSVRVRKS